MAGERATKLRAKAERAAAAIALARAAGARRGRPPQARWAGPGLAQPRPMPRRRSSRCCSRTRSAISWKRELLEPLRRIFDGPRLRAGARARARRSTREVLRGAGVRGAAHARGRRQRAHQHPGELRRLRDAARGERGGGAHHGASPRALGGVISGEHGIGITKLEFLEPAEIDAFAALQGAGRSRGALQPRQAARAAADLADRLHAVLRAHRARVADPRAERHRRDRRLVQGLPALRQVQAGVRDARAARQPALQPAQQDPRDVAAHRGLPLRGADPPRRDPSATSTSTATSPTTARCATSARRPAPWTSTSATCRSRCATCSRRLAQAPLQPGHLGGAAVPQRHRPDDDQAHQGADDRLRATARSAWRTALWGRCRSCARPGAAPARHGRQARARGAGDPFHQQADAGQAAQEDRARAARRRGPGDRADHPRSGEGDRGLGGGVLLSRAAARSASSAQVGLATQALLYHVGSQCVLPPGYLCCGYPQTSAGGADKGERDHGAQPRALPSRGQHAQLPRHQDRGGFVRDVHGPAAEVRVRQDLPGLPAARHPRVPDGEGPRSSKASRACATCTTTPAIRR